MSEFTYDPRILQFIDRLSRLDAGEKARLKRNAGDQLSQARNATTLFYRLLPAGVSQYQEEIYFLVATIYPITSAGGAGNLGDSLRHARDEKTNAKGLDRRIEILLDANLEQLPFRLRQAIQYLQSNRIPVNWQQLLTDLLLWSHPDRPVQRRWARSYFANQNIHSNKEI